MSEPGELFTVKMEMTRFFLIIKVIYSQMLLSNGISNISPDVNKIDQPKLGS